MGEKCDQRHGSLTEEHVRGAAEQLATGSVDTAYLEAPARLRGEAYPRVGAKNDD